ncbi:hypothetical protein [Tenuibacillus multivorans]|uniref:Acetyltransferase (GNAT) domain-containing protein n=1 Tax=Tenuibacillus multivorans TaxID=237069 RepID=A0A1H0AQ33_9BACI|nr:hypothetical protein [Tenuibacillus multivorans]GEL77865.1 hypothetical protein TMU01_21000 [Tenuibacillus multivorans]SDN35618.1 hypothetical protein SAMN05216498_2030 [Tenuibacillus multivorans]
MDKTELDSLIKNYQEEDEIRALLNSSSLIDCQPAYNNKELVGAIITWENEFHPYCTYVKLVVDPNAPYDTENYLFSKVDADKPLQSLVDESDKRAINFFEALDFVRVRKTYIARFNIGTSMIDQQINKKVIPLHKIGLLKSDLVKLVKSNYEKVHIDNPVAKRSHSEWEGLIFASDVNMNGSFIALDEEDRIVAYSFLHNCDNETLELGWCGVSDETHLYLLPQLVLKQGSFAKKVGIQNLEGEFDTTDENAMYVFMELNFEVIESLVMYREEKNSCEKKN